MPLDPREQLRNDLIGAQDTLVPFKNQDAVNRRMIAFFRGNSLRNLKVVDRGSFLLGAFLTGFGVLGLTVLVGALAASDFPRAAIQNDIYPIVFASFMVGTGAMLMLGNRGRGRRK